MFWMIAYGQEIRFEGNEQVKKYGTPLYFKDVVKKLDEAYKCEPIQNLSDVIDLIRDHPKLCKQYHLDEKHLSLENWQGKA